MPPRAPVRLLLLAWLPALAAQAAPAVECEVAVVGAGWAGVYSAWRLAVDAGPASTGGVPAGQVCVFEAYRRPGGRTYTTQIEDYRVDVGAYRFAGDMHLPADLIMAALRLPTSCYDPTCNDSDVRGEVAWPYAQPLRKIVDSSGRHAGYGVALDTMLDQLAAAGARLAFGTELVGVSGCDGMWCLSFRDGVAVRSARVVLNVPRPALARVEGVEQAVGRRWAALACVSRQFPKHVTEGSTTVKVYAVYDDAWWISRLNLTRGVAEDMGDPPVSIHYHDGEVVCSDQVDPGGKPVWATARRSSDLRRCRGVLQVFYRHSQLCPASTPHCMDFWASQPRANSAEPAEVLTEGGAVDSPALRQRVHEKLLKMHAPQSAQRNVSLAGIAPPTALVYSVWAHSGTFPEGDLGMQSGPQDVIFEDSLASVCSGVSSPREYEDMVQGTGNWSGIAPGLHFANNDFAATRSAAWHGPWAEASLLIAERILAGAFGLPRPSWLNGTYYAREVGLRGSARAAYPRQVLV
ncbi:unnamed protein product [Prorocentrum cordatum]|uniref:Amine oxidase n=1 Tax=Prorocentrum cordatum TaxID=2364126 RepID=A0ABN9X9C3_9DINO|nr:unnamed protein product [Polarella glacialis]